MPDFTSNAKLAVAIENHAAGELGFFVADPKAALAAGSRRARDQIAAASAVEVDASIVGDGRIKRIRALFNGSAALALPEPDVIKLPEDIRAKLGNRERMFPVGKVPTAKQVQEAFNAARASAAEITEGAVLDDIGRSGERYAWVAALGGLVEAFEAAAQGDSQNIVLANAALLLSSAGLADWLAERAKPKVAERLRLVEAAKVLEAAKAKAESDRIAREQAAADLAAKGEDKPAVIGETTAETPTPTPTTAETPTPTPTTAETPTPTPTTAETPTPTTAETPTPTTAETPTTTAPIPPAGSGQKLVAVPPAGQNLKTPPAGIGGKLSAAPSDATQADALNKPVNRNVAWQNFKMVTLAALELGFSVEELVAAVKANGKVSERKHSEDHQPQAAVPDPVAPRLSGPAIAARVNKESARKERNAKAVKLAQTAPNGKADLPGGIL